jgi:molybdate transport repressor ModE-like protein/molybdopterin-binding protein
MTRRPEHVTATDVALLAALGQERTVVAASRRVGISRDQAVYRIARLGRAFGGPVVAGERGGRAHGGSQLTELGHRVIREGFDTVELVDARPVATLPPPNLLEGTYRARPGPAVTLAGGLELRVTFPARDAEPVALLLDPEAILVARRRFPTSARNVVRAAVESVAPGPGRLDRTLGLRVGPVRLRASVTAETVRQMRLRPGARVWLYVKATALRRVAGRRGRLSRGSLPS